MESPPTASNNEFTHETLPDPAKYMRLLEVLDDNYSKTTKVRCRLTTWPIDSMPVYHAVSYTWGDPKLNTFILMNDKTLEVRKNCEFALKQVYWYKKSQSFLYRKRQSHLYRETRSEWYTESRYFWVDALCIDQSNDEEKSKQVAMMGSIYKNASHVLSCIGDHADDSLFFFQTLYGPAHHVVPARRVFTPSDPEMGNQGVSLKFQFLHRYSTTHRFVLALARLAIRPYFTRMWILQELQHARSTTILCGEYVLSKEDAICLFNGVSDGLKRFDWRVHDTIPPDAPFEYLLQNKFSRRSVNFGMPHPIWHGDWICMLPQQCTATVLMLKQNYLTVKHDIFQLLKDVVYRLQCEDPRDKVYGLISLIDWSGLEPLEPDYTQTDLEVAVNFIKKIMTWGDVRGLDEPIWRYVVVIVKLFNFNNQSRGFSEALESRRGFTGNHFMCVKATDFARSTLRLEEADGWRLTPKDLEKNASNLQGLQATPARSPVGECFYLPRWAAANDWVIRINRLGVADIWCDSSRPRYVPPPPYIPLLVMREGTRGRCNALIGYGFYSVQGGFYRPSFQYDSRVDVIVDLDIEDAMVFFWRMKQLYEVRLGATDWILDYLNIGVCKQQTPWSSFAMLPLELPHRMERHVPTNEERALARQSAWEHILHDFLRVQKNRRYILFDTRDRRGWLVDGHVVVLQLLCAYLRNLPQAEPFDFSKWENFEPDKPMAAYQVLSEWDNLNIPILRILEDVGQTPTRSEALNSTSHTERKLIADVLGEIANTINDIKPNQEFPGDPLRFNPDRKRLKRRRDVMVKGWDFERMYRNNKRGKVYTHRFARDPGWLDLAKDLDAKLIFGCGFGDIMKRRDDCCCPYFKSVPLGQDYLAADTRIIRQMVNRLAGSYENDVVVARFSSIYYLAWERGVDPFSHSHGHGNHLEKVDSSCFPVHRVVRAPHVDDEQKTDKRFLKKKWLYSIQDINDMLVAGDTDAMTSDNGRTGADEKTLKLEMVVFGNVPGEKQLRRLAQANLRDEQS